MSVNEILQSLCEKKLTNSDIDSLRWILPDQFLEYLIQILGEREYKSNPYPEYELSKSHHSPSSIKVNLEEQSYKIETYKACQNFFKNPSKAIEGMQDRLEYMKSKRLEKNYCVEYDPEHSDVSKQYSSQSRSFRKSHSGSRSIKSMSQSSVASRRRELHSKEWSDNQRNQLRRVKCKLPNEVQNAKDGNENASWEQKMSDALEGSFLDENDKLLQNAEKYSLRVCKRNPTEWEKLDELIEAKEKRNLERYRALNELKVEIGVQPEENLKKQRHRRIESRVETHKLKKKIAKLSKRTRAKVKKLAPLLK